MGPSKEQISQRQAVQACQAFTLPDYAAGEWKNMRNNLAEGLTGAHRLRTMPPE
jgi:hypothetical protein